jgi:hypothetical protein
MSQNIILPDAPVLLVHKGWGPAGSKGTESTSIYVTTRGLHPVTTRQQHEESATSSAQPAVAFKFVDMATPPSRDAKASKRVKSLPRRVRQVPRAGKKQRRNTDENIFKAKDTVAPEILEKESNDVIALDKLRRAQRLPLVCSGSASAFYGGGFPFKMNAQMSSLINVCELIRYLRSGSY